LEIQRRAKSIRSELIIRRKPHAADQADREHLIFHLSLRFRFFLAQRGIFACFIGTRPVWLIFISDAAIAVDMCMFRRQKRRPQPSLGAASKICNSMKILLQQKLKSQKKIR
jgi:hypothetical protein